MDRIFRRYNIALLALWMTLLASCATQLAPLYDKAIVDGITTANREAMTLFASLSAGSSRDSFAERADNYNRIIGSLDALEIQARARPTPKTSTLEAVNNWLEKRGLPAVSDDDVPSATALNRISATLKKMRDTDRKQGVTATEVQAFKNQLAIYMDQAITYEAFLQR